MSLHAGNTTLIQTRTSRSSFSHQPPLLAPDVALVLEQLADLVRTVLRAKLVCIVSETASANLYAMAAGSPEFAASVRTRYSRGALQFAGDLARRALATGEVISVSIDSATHGLEGLVSAGMLLAVPIRTSQIQGAILAYPRAEGNYSAEEKSLLLAMSKIAAAAISDAERRATAESRVKELQRLLQFSETGSNQAEPARLGQILDAISDFIVVHDECDQVVCVNRPLADFIGVQPQDVLGVKMSALFALDAEIPQHSCLFCRTTSDAMPHEYILPVLDRSYLVSTSRVHSGDDAGWQTIHVLKDITDRQEAERRYRQLFDNIQEGIFFATADGRFVEVNDALVRMLGYSNRQDLLQADIRSQVCSSIEGFDELARVMRDHGAVGNYELTLHRADGVLIHVLVNAFAVRDAQQNVLQYRGAMQDISGLKTSQSELHRERDFSAKILDNTQSLILVADTSGRVTYANRRWYEMGYQQHQLLGRPLEELIAESRRRALAEAFAATLNGQQVDSLELQVMRGEGRAGHFAVNLSPIRDEQGNIASIVLVMSDVTDSATLQAKLMHAEKMAAVGQLVSGVAHEVNNPLTAILGFADLLLENPEMPDSARKDLRVILQEAQRTKQIVQNLLSFARQMPPQRKPVHLNVILRRTVQLRAYDLHSRGVEVIQHLQPDLQQVIGDSHQLQQVFLNILNNAYDAVRDSGRPARIDIRTTNVDDCVEVLFRDNGRGIEFPERIFDPFFTTKEIGKGTGLGLSICYGIVREHGGEITCHNNSDGEGATFIVRLPAVSETASVGAAAGVTQP